MLLLKSFFIIKYYHHYHYYNFFFFFYNHNNHHWKVERNLKIWFGLIKVKFVQYLIKGCTYFFSSSFFFLPPKKFLIFIHSCFINLWIFVCVITNQVTEIIIFIMYCITKYNALCMKNIFPFIYCYIQSIWIYLFFFC